MARSSRQKSHRSHKHRDRSESEDEGSFRDRKMKVEEEESARVSRVSDQEKRKSSSKDGVGTSSGDVVGDYRKKQKDRDGDSAIVGDRWNGGGDDGARVEKESKKEGSCVLDLEKSSKLKSSGGDSKGRSSSSRRREGSSDKNEERRRSEKESSRRESSGSHYKDGKEKDRDRERERGLGKDKKVQDSKHEKFDVGASRREEHSLKQGVEISELQAKMQELEKESDKRSTRRRDGSGDQDRLDDEKKGDDRQESSRAEHSKNGNYKDGRYKEKYREELDKEKYREELDKEKYREELDKEKYREELDTDHRHHDYKCKDERSSRTHIGERSDSKHSRDDHDSSCRVDDEKSMLQDSGRRGSRRADDHSTKLKDNRGRKRSSAEIEDQNDMKSRSTNEPHDDGSKNGSSSSKFDSRSDRTRLEHLHSDRVDSTLSNSRTKNSPNANAYSRKDQIRHNSSPGSRVHSASGGRERISGSRSSEKAKLKGNNHSDTFMTDGGSFLHHDKVLRSDARSSPNQLREKSPISTSERRSERISSRCSLDMEEGGQRSSSSSKGKKGDSSFLNVNFREREFLTENPGEDDSSQVELLKREHVSVGPSSNRAVQLQSSSPAHLPPPLPVRIGVDSPSVLGSYEDETRSQSGERKINTRYKRCGDSTVGRGPGNPRKGPPTWPSPVANGFMPLQHGPPAGFHPGIQQFPAPSVFGMRPPMDLNNPSYHIHDGNRFPGHVRPFGWHNSVDDCPHLHVWDGNANVFGDESHIYGRQEWDQNRHLLSSRGWEMSTDMWWNRQNANANMDFPVPQKEDEYSCQAQVDEASIGLTGHNSRDERRSEQSIADSSGIKLPSDSSLAKRAVAKYLSEKTPELSKMPSLNGTSEKQSDNDRYWRSYLSKLDISPDLVEPELYKRCISLMGVRERNVTDNILTLEQRKNNVEGLRLVASSKHVHESLFPTTLDANFQRAMSLYKKQKEAMKAAMHTALPLACAEQQTNSLESNDQKVSAMSMDHVEESLPSNTLSGYHMEEDNNRAAADEGEHYENPSETEEQLGDKPIDDEAQVEISIVAEEKRFDKNSDAVISVEGSKQSEAIIPECRVNLSRIHLSPESTH